MCGSRISLTNGAATHYRVFVVLITELKPQSSLIGLRVVCKG